MSPLALHKQPFKGLYLSYQLITTIFFRVPLWILLAIPRQDLLLVASSSCNSI